MKVLNSYNCVKIRTLLYLRRRKNNGRREKTKREIITDVYVGIEDSFYHIECQSNEDDTMELRMLRYDFAIAWKVQCGKMVIVKFIFQNRVYYICEALKIHRMN